MTVARETFKCRKQSLGPGLVARGEFVMRPLAGQKGPAASNPGTVERPAVFVLTVAVAIVAMPARSWGQIDLQERVDCPHGVENARVVCGSQPETYERERVGAHHQCGFLAARLRRPVFDRDEATHG